MYYFIINPASGSGRGGAVWKTVREELDRLGTDYRHFLLKSAGEGTKLAAALSESKTPCTIVVVGGDGTINEVVNGLTSFEHITFACIPTGSGNDFVRGLGLPRDPVKALHAILNPTKILPVNVGHTRLFPAAPPSDGQTAAALDSAQNTVTPLERNYIVSTGIGFDAAVCNSVQESRLKKMLNRFHSGKLVYLLTALWQLFTMKRPDFKVTLENGETMVCEKAYFAAAMNLCYEGGGFLFCPDALPDNDLLDLLVVDKIPRLYALCLLPLALKGKHVGHKGIHIFRCRSIQIESPSPLCVHTDGEIPGFSNNVTFSLHEKKLAVILR